MPEFTKEEVDSITDNCLEVLRHQGVMVEKPFIWIKSGSLGIRHLGKADWLAKHGYKVVFTDTLPNLNKKRRHK